MGAPGGGRVGTGDGPPPGGRVGTGPVGIIVGELGVVADRIQVCAIS